MSADPHDLPYSQPLRVAQLNSRRSQDLSLAPDAADRARIAAALDLSELPSVQLTGRLAPAPNDAWELTGWLTAEVVQPCVITLAPVHTRIDEPVHRIWSPHVTPPEEGGETEMPPAEVDPLGQTIDPAAVLVEELTLALPDYPRAPGAALPGTEDNPEPDTRRPFAGLADLLGSKT